MPFPLKSSELILNPDGSIYHLGLHPHEVAQTIITVGDPERVGAVTKHFDTLEFTREKREFVTQTGTLKGKRITVISTGIGTDNIDIVFNELHALVNLNLTSGTPKQGFTPLDFVRIGTSGAVQAEIPVGSVVLSTWAVGFDGLMHFYDVAEHSSLLAEFYKTLPSLKQLPAPYFAPCSEALAEVFTSIVDLKGVTLTAPGFYAPQGRSVSLKAKLPHFIDLLKGAQLRNLAITNIEMETAGIYGLAEAMGHRAVSLSALLANRATGAFAEHPQKLVDALIERVLRVLVP
jgi:uridine phosphorylase